MSPASWREMVDRTRELENALGCGIKQVEENEKDTVVIQRRSIRAVADLPAGTILTRDHMTILRPCPAEGLPPYRVDELIGRQLRQDIRAGEHLRWINVE
jgi:N-acetylneuraminate synthase